MGERRVIQGTVVSDKMAKTVVVSVEQRKKHRLYHKVINFTARFKAHDENDECKLGDIVRIEESRPMSKDKRWRVIEVLTRGDVAEVAPSVIGRELEETTQVAPKHEDTGDEPEAAAEAEDSGEVRS